MCVACTQTLSCEFYRADRRVKCMVRTINVVVCQQLNHQEVNFNSPQFAIKFSVFELDSFFFGRIFKVLNFTLLRQFISSS